MSSFFCYLAILTTPISFWVAFEIYGQSSTIKDSTSLFTIAVLLLIACTAPLGFLIISFMLLPWAQTITTHDIFFTFPPVNNGWGFSIAKPRNKLSILHLTGFVHVVNHLATLCYALQVERIEAVSMVVMLSSGLSKTYTRTLLEKN